MHSLMLIIIMTKQVSRLTTDFLIGDITNNRCRQIGEVSLLPGPNSLGKAVKSCRFPHMKVNCVIKYVVA